MSHSSLSRIRSRLRRTIESRRLARRKRLHRARSLPGRHEKRVVFVVGCQRSGTTLLGRLLDRCLDVDCFHETDRHAFTRMRIRDQQTRETLIQRSTARCIVFKPICDSHRTGELLVSHSRSRAIWIYRRWQDVVNSAVERWGDHWQAVVGDIVAGHQHWGWRQEGISGQCIQQIRSLWRPEMSAHDAMAIFWLIRNRIYFDNGLDQRSDVLLVRYEALVTAPEPEFARICDFVGISCSTAAVEPVFATSISKAPCPVHDVRLIGACDELLARLDTARRMHNGDQSAPRNTPTVPMRG